MSNQISERGKLVQKVLDSQVPESPKIPGVDKSKGIDDLLIEGLYQIQRILFIVKQQIDMGKAERDTVQNLKDVMALLFELKKREKELLDEMSPEDLGKFLRKQHVNDEGSS